MLTQMQWAAFGPQSYVNLLPETQHSAAASSLEDRSVQRSSACCQPRCSDLAEVDFAPSRLSASANIASANGTAVCRSPSWEGLRPALNMWLTIMGPSSTKHSKTTSLTCLRPTWPTEKTNTNTPWNNHGSDLFVEEHGQPRPRGHAIHFQRPLSPRRISIFGSWQRACCTAAYISSDAFGDGQGGHGRKWIASDILKRWD